MKDSLRLISRVNGYKTVAEMAKAFGLTYRGLHSLYTERPEEFKLRLKSILEQRKND